MDQHPSLSPTVLGEQAYLRAAMERIAALLETPASPRRQQTLRQEARWAAERLARLPGADTALGHRVRNLLTRLGGGASVHLHPSVAHGLFGVRAA